jgi:phosphopantothenoylcysteine decarboxylase
METRALETSEVEAGGRPTAIGSKRKTRILLGVTGSVAAVKAPEIAVRICRETDSHVKILLTRGGKTFWDKAKEYSLFWWEAYEKLATAGRTEDHNDAQPHIELICPYSQNCLPQSVPLYNLFLMSPCVLFTSSFLLDSEDEWRDWNRLGDPVMHIALRDWADLLVIAPLSAHTLAKLAHGLCDDALSSVARAWDWGHVQDRPAKPIVFSPAMNTAMWQHPITATQLQTVQSFWNTDAAAIVNANKDNSSTRSGVVVVQPQVKTLACGELGNGALAPVNDIIDAVQSTLMESSRTE